MIIFAVRLILEDQGRLLFLRQRKRNGGRYTLIGGNVEETEFAREALAREAEEEAAIHVSPEDMTLVHVLHRHKLAKSQTLLVLYFRASRFKGDTQRRDLLGVSRPEQSTCLLGAGWSEMDWFNRFLK